MLRSASTVTMRPAVSVTPKVAMSVLSSATVEPGMLPRAQFAELFQLPATSVFHESLVAKTGDTIANARVRDPNALEYWCFMVVLWLGFERDGF